MEVFFIILSILMFFVFVFMIYVEMKVSVHLSKNKNIKEKFLYGDILGKIAYYFKYILQ